MRSRAFIIGDVNDKSKRVVYVSVDNGMGFEIIKTEVVDRLNQTFGPDLYTDKNVLMTGTHMFVSYFLEKKILYGSSLKHCIHINYLT